MGPDLFYPSGDESVYQAQIVCMVCPVRPECEQWANGHGGWQIEREGVWGGKSARRRAAERKAA